ARCQVEVSGTTLTRAQPGTLTAAVIGGCMPDFPRVTQYRWQFNGGPRCTGGDTCKRTTTANTTPVTMVDSRRAYAVNVEAVDAQGATQCSGQASLTVNARTGPEWTLRPVLILPDVDLTWGRLPEVVEPEPGYYAAKVVAGELENELASTEKLRRALEPQENGWADAARIAPVNDPGGPNHGWAYVAETALRVEMRARINQYLLENGPLPLAPPPCTGNLPCTPLPNFWQENHQACEAVTGCFPAEFVQAVIGHEVDGAWGPSSTGHFGELTKELRTGDPRELVEKLVDETGTSGLQATLIAALNGREEKLRRKAGHAFVGGNWPPPTVHACAPGPCNPRRASFWRALHGYNPRCGVSIEQNF
ncbi:MAG: hypothetical protein HY904_18915, partial [Deltaproteobacteria bacterium]|nr:hypothetical protein [Deltaproteobacteria bacterium]